MNSIWAPLLTALLLFLPSGQAFAQTQKTNFFLPQNPVAAAYVLGRLSNQELIAAPRSEFVYVALLQRAGLDRKYRLEALDGLATLRHTDRLSELLAGLSALDKKGEDSPAAIRDLLPILLQSSPAESAAKRGRVPSGDSKLPTIPLADPRASFPGRGSRAPGRASVARLNPTLADPGHLR